MAKIQINPLASTYNLDTALNLRLQQIEDTLNDNVLWRDGFVGEPNQMEVDLDMNGRTILNVAEITSGGVGVIDLIEANTALIEINTLDIAALDVRVTSNEGNISSNATNITNNANDITALDIRVTANEGDIAANAADILTNSADILTKEDALGNPSTDGYVLSSTAAGVRSWKESGGGIGDLTITSVVGSDTINSDKDAFNLTGNGTLGISLASAAGAGTPDSGYDFSGAPNPDLLAKSPDDTGVTQGVVFSDGSTVMWNDNASGNPKTLHMRSLTTPWDVTTASTDTELTYTGGSANGGSIFQFNADGTKMYGSYIPYETIFEYPLSTAYDPSSAGVAQQSNSLFGGGTPADGPSFSQDGLHFFATTFTSTTQVVAHWALTTAWDVTDIGVAPTDFNDLVVSGISAKPAYYAFDVQINDDGTKLYALSHDEDFNDFYLDEFTLVTPYNTSTAVWVSETVMSIPGDFSVDTGTRSFQLSLDGTKMYIYTDTQVVQYDISAGDAVPGVGTTTTTLYHDGVAKLETASTGVDVTGDVTATSFNSVPLTAAGVATNFLTEAGTYVPAGGGEDYVTIADGGTLPLAAGANAIAVGAASSAAGSNSIAMGNSAQAVRPSQIAIGNQAGSFTGTNGDYTVAIGDNAKVRGIRDIAIGYQTLIQSGDRNICIGSQNSITTAGEDAVLLGRNSSVTKLAQNSIGSTVTAASVTSDVAYSSKMGFGSSADANYNLLHLYGKGKLELYGSEAQYVIPSYITGSIPATTVTGGLVYDTTTSELKVYDAGWNAIGGGGGGNAYFACDSTGAAASATGTDSVAAGEDALSSGSGAVALGQLTDATNIYSVAVGYGAQATGLQAIALGTSVASATQAVALGAGSDATVTGATALGTNAQATAQYATGVGNTAGASKDYQVSIGYLTDASSVTTDVAYSAKMGFGDELDANFNLLHLYGKGKLELEGSEAQYVIPGYATGSIPATTVTGGMIYDTSTSEVKIYDGGWTAIGGGGGFSPTWAGLIDFDAGAAVTTDAVAGGNESIAIGDNCILGISEQFTVALGNEISGGGTGYNTLVGHNVNVPGGAANYNTYIGANCGSSTLHVARNTIVGSDSTANKGTQVVVGHALTDSSPTSDSSYSTKIGNDLNASVQNFLHLVNNGKCYLYGNQAQYVVPNYATASEPTAPVSGGLIYDSTTDKLKTSDGSTWTEYNTGGTRTKIVEIGDWDMDGTAQAYINHGLADHIKIRGLEIMIRDDLDTTIRNAVHGLDSYYANSTQVVILRTTGGEFDGTGYDTATAFNRGWITITYVD